MARDGYAVRLDPFTRAFIATSTERSVRRVVRYSRCRGLWRAFVLLRRNRRGDRKKFGRLGGRWIPIYVTSAVFETSDDAEGFLDELFTACRRPLRKVRV